MYYYSFTFANSQHIKYKQNNLQENSFCNDQNWYENNEDDVVKSCKTFTVTIVLVLVEISLDVTVCCGCRAPIICNPGCWIESSANQARIFDSFIDVSDLVSKYSTEITELQIKESSKEKLFKNNFTVKTGIYKIIKDNDRFYIKTKLIKAN